MPRVIDETEKTDSVSVGSTVTIQESDNPVEIYTIVGPAEASPRDGRISNELPLGRALMEKRAGDTVKVDAPAGSFSVRVLKVA